MRTGIMPTKIELTLEQSQQGVSNNVLVSIEGVEELKRNVWIKGLKKKPSTHFRQKPGQYIIYQIHKDEFCSQAVNKSPTHYLCDFSRTFRVILFSIHSDERKSFQSQPQIALRYKRRCCSLIPAEFDSLPHAHDQTTKTYYKHQESRIKKAQEFKTKTSANSDIQDLPLRYQVYQGRLLASFQDDAKYEHVGQDTRWQRRSRQSRRNI
ncbi:hypothetical protein Tco_0729966 [Tanacetum coccineum]|uniref:Uncharacterized protein n=1 Tax=Tanacetum coccineum TaxID=301880 RepID=A0ABQ4YQV9_9ASTR